MPAQPPAPEPEDPQAPLGHLSRLGFALVGAASVDEIACMVLDDLAALPGVRRVGFALSEGGGRRLRFTASDRVADGNLNWCHIDAYDDVPLTMVMRTGESLLAAREGMGRRFAEFMAGQPAEVLALAVVPLPGIGSPIGGIVLFLDEVWSFDEPQHRLLDATARRVAEAVRRVRFGGALEPDLDDQEHSVLTARIVLEDNPRASGVARRFLREFLARFDVADDLTDTAQLCVSELVTNAIVHAGTRSELRATLDGVLTVSVSDRGGAGDQHDAAPDAEPHPLRVHGRGLQLVAALADRWGSERDAVGTTVWFVLELDRPHEGASDTG